MGQYFPKPYISFGVNINVKVDLSNYATKADLKNDKYIITPEFNDLGAGVFTVRLAQANLVRKTDFDTKLKILNKKNNSNRAKHLLVENELKKKLQTFDSRYFRSKNHFEEHGTKNYLVFQPIGRYFERIIGVGNSEYI